MTARFPRQNKRALVGIGGGAALSVVSTVVAATAPYVGLAGCVGGLALIAVSGVLAARSSE